MQFNTIPRNISVLGISHKQQTILSTHSFISMTHFTNFYLGHKQIYIIVERAFVGLSNLRTLDLAGNELNSVPDISLIVTLRYLALTRNPMRVIKYEDSKMAVHLYQSYIGGAKAKFSFLPHCPNMAYLYLPGNDLGQSLHVLLLLFLFCFSEGCQIWLNFDLGIVNWLLSQNSERVRRRSYCFGFVTQMDIQHHRLIEIAISNGWICRKITSARCQTIHSQG